MFDYAIAEAIHIIGGITFGVWFYKTVLRPMQEYCKSCERFRKFVEEDCA